MRKPLLALITALTMSLAAQAAMAQPPISSQEALTRLKEGNARFAKGYMTTFPLAELRKSTAAGAQPIAAVLACSDSRLPVEDIFNQGIGDLYVVRVAGNSQSVSVTGSLEYAAEEYGTPLLVVLGHSRCDAVAAVVDKAEKYGNIPAMLAPIAPAVAKAAELSGSGDANIILNKSISENVGQSMEDLFKSSPIIRKLAREKRLEVVGALYDLESGEVRWLGPHPNMQNLIVN